MKASQTHSSPETFSCPLTHSLTHTLTHTPTHTLTHSLTHSLTHTHPLVPIAYRSPFCGIVSIGIAFGWRMLETLSTVIYHKFDKSEQFIINLTHQNSLSQIWGRVFHSRGASAVSQSIRFLGFRRWTRTACFGLITRVSIYVCTYMCTNTYIVIYVCQYMYTNVCISIYVCQYMYVNICISIYVYQYMYGEPYIQIKINFCIVNTNHFETRCPR